SLTNNARTPPDKFALNTMFPRPSTAIPPPTGKGADSSLYVTPGGHPGARSPVRAISRIWPPDAIQIPVSLAVVTVGPVSFAWNVTAPSSVSTVDTPNTVRAPKDSNTASVPGAGCPWATIGANAPPLDRNQSDSSSAGE